MMHNMYDLQCLNAGHNTGVLHVLIWMLYFFTHMLQEYGRNVSVVLVLCCNKCFMLQVASVLSGYCIHFTHML